MPTQASRTFEVTTPLGADALLLRRMHGRERLGHPFEYELELLSEQSGIAPADLLGQGASVRVNLPGEGQRHFHGLVTAFGGDGKEGRLFRYRARLRPWLWILSRTADCRIFQNQTVPDIIKAIFRDAGFSDFKESLSGTYRTWEYCVQYRETDFAFVSRLMEHEGIYYYFEHEAAKHTLVLADGYSSHAPATGYAEVPWYPRDEQRDEHDEYLWTFDLGHEIQPGACELTDFDFERPSVSLKARSAGGGAHAHDTGEVYDYPGDYIVNADGDAYTAIRLEESKAKIAEAFAEGNPRGIGAGHLVTLTGHERESLNAEYLIVGTDIHLSQNIYETGLDPGKEHDGWLLRLALIPGSVTFRSPRVTPKAVVQGPQTATVVGKAGEEIWTDKYGRVKVQFHWDREGAKDENSSCWVRVAQYWAGKNWGSIHIPRIGQEVIVDFLEGDPDRPIITGRVYNAEVMPPYTLPDNQSQSGVKSRSTKQGDTTTFNELRFEDKKGEEQVYFHAEKNFDRVVENNDTLKVGFEKKDKGDQTIEIHNNQRLVVGNANSEDGSQTIEIWKNRTETVKEGNESVTVSKGNRTVTVSEGNDAHTVSKGNRTVTVSEGNDTLTITQGDQTVTITAGKNTTEAGTSIELKVGGSSVKIEPAKITLKSVQIAIQGDAKVEIKAPMIDVSADAMLTLKGGLIKVN